MFVNVSSFVEGNFATGAFVMKFDIFLMSSFDEFKSSVKPNQGVTTSVENKLGNIDFMFSARSSVHESQSSVSRSVYSGVCEGGRRRRSDPSWHLSNNVPSSTLTIF